MAVLIGTDEAGYGPNLGPLVISATAWEVPDGLAHVDLFELLRSAVSREAQPGLLAIADSKLLYQPGAGLAGLERGVLGALSTSAGPLGRWRDVWRALAPASASYLDDVAWYAGYDERIPIDTAEDEIRLLGGRFVATLGQLQVSLRSIRSSVIFPARFNRLLERYESKGAALSHETLDLVKDMIAECPGARTKIRCDKHGGRNRYGPLLQTVFPEYLVEVAGEGRGESIYRWGPKSRRVEIRFTARGETHLPTALASMASKYLRELAMRAFNQFWQARVPQLRPTAGYPVDARRFKEQIAQVQADLGIDDRVLWRNK